MTVYDELVARGLIAQVTNEEEIKKMINEGKATFYILALILQQIVYTLVTLWHFAL